MDSAKVSSTVASSDKKCRHCGQLNPPSARFCNSCGKSMSRPVPFDGLLAEGTILRGAWVIEDVIGEGGMGVVYRAHHQTLRSRYAIKVLDSKLARHATLRDRFLEEARIQATLSHPNIVRVHDVLDEGGVFGMVMEHIDGRTLDEYIHDEVGQVGLLESINITVALLDAIGHAHRAGVIHRDLKPSNVLLVRGHDPEDIGPDLKVMDFGIAKILADDGGRTVTGAKMGTPRYMAPEQVRNARDVDGRTDLYAIGLTLYEMICGRHPYEELRDYDLLKAQVEKPVPPPSSYRPELPADLERVILRSLEKRADRRYPDAEAFIDALVDLDTSRRTMLRRGRTRTRRPNDTPEQREVSALASAYTAPAQSELDDEPAPAAAPVRQKTAAPRVDTPPPVEPEPSEAGASEADGDWSLGDTSVTRHGERRSRSAADPSLHEPAESSYYEDSEYYEDDDRRGAGRWIVRLIIVALLAGVGWWGYQTFFGGGEEERGKPAPLSGDQIRGGDPTDHTQRSGSGGRPSVIETVSTTTGRMSRLPAGEHIIGALPDEAGADEQPSQTITLPALDIDQTEVSLFQYQRCVAEESCQPLGDVRGRSPNEPVTGIGYASAEAFCTWAGKRLPTEAEWEAAARAGQPARYPLEGTPDCANVHHGAAPGGECAGNNRPGVESVFERELGKNRLHLRQLAGNVWEWTSTPGRSPQERIVKGGSWRSARSELRVGTRRSVKANVGDEDVGFRCVKVVP